MYKFKIGQKIVFKEDSPFAVGEIGEIIRRTNYNGMKYNIRVNSPIRCGGSKDFGLEEYFNFYCIPENFLESLDLELLKQRNKLKEEMRLAHIDTDPFGEEKW